MELKNVFGASGKLQQSGGLDGTAGPFDSAKTGNSRIYIVTGGSEKGEEEGDGKTGTVQHALRLYESGR